MSWTDENFKISARSCYLHLTSPWDGTFKIHSSQMLGVLLMKCYFYIFELVFFTHIFHYIISKEVQRRYVFFCTFSSKFVYLAPEIRPYSIHYIFFVVNLNETSSRPIKSTTILNFTFKTGPHIFHCIITAVLKFGF